MDLRQLRYFLATVESRSFGKAAEKLHVTQPALSKAVRRLELSLGVRLLDRLPRGVSPTIYGEALAAHADLIEGELMPRLHLAATHQKNLHHRALPFPVIVEVVLILEAHPGEVLLARNCFRTVDAAQSI